MNTPKEGISQVADNLAPEAGRFEIEQEEPQDLAPIADSPAPQVGRSDPLLDGLTSKSGQSSYRKRVS
jgi:hypothetical protein